MTNRLLTSMVGVVFVFSMLAAQLPHCQCGVWCLHLQDPKQQVPATPPVSEGHGCCPSDGQADAPAQQPLGETDPCGDDEECPCPVKADAEKDLVYTPLAFTRSSYNIQSKLISAVTTHSTVSPLTEMAERPRWCPTRGSPYVRRPHYALNSTYII